MENARLKGSGVARQYPDHWVLGADTLVWIDDQILGKPKDMEEAEGMLGNLFRAYPFGEYGALSFPCYPKTMRKPEWMAYSQVTFKPLMILSSRPTFVSQSSR